MSAGNRAEAAPRCHALPAGERAWNPAFDVNPAELIDAIVTERGVVLSPTREKMATLMRA